MTATTQCFHGKTKRQFLNPNSINPHLTCSICLEVFQQPHRLICGHTFCYTCIQNWAKINKKTTCAQCKYDFSRRKPQKDLLASKMVDQLEVKCIHPGCNWTNINSLLKKHQRICKYKQKKQISKQFTNNLINLQEIPQPEIIQIKQKNKNTTNIH